MSKYNIETKKIIKNKLFSLPDFIQEADSEEINKFYDKLLIDNDSVFYISTPEDSSMITNIIMQHCILIGIEPTFSSITDCTAGVGGNAISFAKNFKSVNAIELEHIRYKYLVNNIEQYKFKNVTTYCDNALNIIHQLPDQNVVFFDPPWGGKGYNKTSNIVLQLTNHNIETICYNLFNDSTTKCTPDIVTLKLPKNYDLKNLYTELNKIKKIKLFIYDLKKMYIVIIHK
jgi:16S rRNA G966 N2-methylase RsmD